MSDTQEPPVLWALWNPTTGDYDRYEVIDDPYDIAERHEAEGEVILWTSEEREHELDSHRVRGFLWVRLTPEIVP